VQLLRGEDTTADPLSTNGGPLISLPFDRAHAKTRAAPLDANTIFAGTLSSQSKQALMDMAGALSIPTSEKVRKQELMLMIRDYLNTNPEVRNGTRFAKVTWQSANRNKTTCATSTLSSRDAVIPPGQLQASESFCIPSHTPVCPPFHFLQTHDSMAGSLATGSHPTPATSSLHALHEPFLYFPPPVMPAYFLPQIPPTNGLQHNLHGHVVPDIQPFTHTSHFTPDNFYRDSME
jgi:hypothetical protein